MNGKAHKNTNIQSETDTLLKFRIASSKDEHNYKASNMIRGLSKFITWQK